MRFYPTKIKVPKDGKVSTGTLQATRIVALVLAFLSVFMFFFKLLFF